jgi:hypothetical protein
MAAEHNIDTARDEISKIKANLAAAIAKGEEAAAFLATLKQIGLAIDVAKEAVAIGKALPDSGVKAGDTKEMMEQELEDFTIENDKYILHYHQQWELEKKLTTDEAAKLKPILQNSGAPPDIVNWQPGGT